MISLPPAYNQISQGFRDSFSDLQLCTLEGNSVYFPLHVCYGSDFLFYLHFSLKEKKKKHFAAAVITRLLPMNKRNHHKKKKKYRLLSVWLSCWSFGYKLDLEFRHHLLHTCYRLLDKKVPKPKDSEVQWYFSQPPRQPTFIPHGNINNINVPEFTVHDRFLLPAGPTSTRLVAAMLKTIQPATHNINSCLNMWLAGGFKIPFMFLYPVTLLD